MLTMSLTHKKGGSRWLLVALVELYLVDLPLAIIAGVCPPLLLVSISWVKYLPMVLFAVWVILGIAYEVSLQKGIEKLLKVGGVSFLLSAWLASPQWL